MGTFIQKLDKELDGVTIEQDKIARIDQIEAQIGSLKNQIAQLEIERNHETERLLGDLAVAVRKEMPDLSINLRGGNCCISHLSNNLSIRPNFLNKVWDIEPNQCGRRFCRRHGHALHLSKDISPLSLEIKKFFADRYKRLKNKVNNENVALSSVPNAGRPVQCKGVSRSANSTQYY